MLKSVKWIENDIYSLNLKNELYTLIQMRKNHIMQFFDIKNSKDEWDGIDLNNFSTIFFKPIAIKEMKSLLSKKINPQDVIHSFAPIEKKVLMLNFEIGTHHSTNLVELSEKLEAHNGKVVIENLTVEHNLDEIYKYELASMDGDPKKISERLIRYFDTGINWDKSKEFLFKNVLPPPPHYGINSK